VHANSSGFAQKISATVDKDKILIGEHILLSLKYEGTNQLLNISDSIGKFEVLKRLPVDTLQVSGQNEYVQKFELLTFDTGTVVIPAVTLTGTKISSEKIEITVLPADIKDLKDYNELKDILPANPPENTWRKIWLLFVYKIFPFLIFAGVLVFLYLKYGRKKKNILSEKSFNLQDVLKQIDFIKEEYLLKQKNHKLYFSELIRIGKQFTDALLHTKTVMQTTDEMMPALSGKIKNEKLQTDFFQLLRLSDAVKFAKHIPDNQQSENAATTIKNVVNEIDNFKQQADAS
jgi:hypothetical protein